MKVASGTILPSLRVGLPSPDHCSRAVARADLEFRVGRGTRFRWIRAEVLVMSLVLLPVLGCSSAEFSTFFQDFAREALAAAWL